MSSRYTPLLGGRKRWTAASSDCRTSPFPSSSTNRRSNGIWDACEREWVCAVMCSGEKTVKKAPGTLRRCAVRPSFINSSNSFFHLSYSWRLVQQDEDIREEEREGIKEETGDEERNTTLDISCTWVHTGCESEKKQANLLGVNTANPLPCDIPRGQRLCGKNCAYEIAGEKWLWRRAARKSHENER